MKKIYKALALMLSLMMVFSAISVVFSVPVSAAEAGDTYSTTITATNYTDYADTTKDTIAYAIGERSDGLATAFPLIRPAKDNTEGSAYFTFKDFGGTSLLNPTLSWHGRAIYTAGDYAAVYVSADGTNWKYVSAVAKGGSYTPVGATQAVTVSENNNTSPSVTDLAATFGSDFAEVKALYVRVDLKAGASGVGMGRVYCGNLTVTGTYAEAVEETRKYNVALGKNFGDDTTYLPNATVAAHVVEYDNMAFISSQMLPPTKGKEGYTIFKFDADEGFELSDLTVTWSGRGIQNVNNRVDVYVSNDMTDWKHTGGVGHADLGYAVNDNQKAPYSVDVSSYISKPMPTLYVKVVILCGSGSWGTLYTLNVNGTQKVAKQQIIRDYNVSLGNNFYNADNTANNALGSDADYIVDSYNIQGSTRNDLGGSIIMPLTKNTLSYATFKFAPGEGKVFTEAAISWSGRGIQNAGNYVNVYYSDSVNGEWIYFDGVGHVDSGYTSNSNIGKPGSIDLTPIIGDGLDAVYVKVELYSNYQYCNWAALKTLAVTGKYTDGTKDAEINDYVFSSKLGGDIYVGDVQTATVTTNPFWLDAGEMTATSNSDILDVAVDGNTITATATGIGAATLTVNVGDETYTYDYNIAASWINDDYDETVTVTTANQVDASKFYEFENISAPFAKEAGAAVKLSAVSFADFMDAGSNFVKANVSWGATGEGAASFDVYVDSIEDANKIATLYATPYGGSVTKQVANSYLAKVITGETRDIYVVFNTPGSALHDITFGNMGGSYDGANTVLYGKSSQLWDVNMINYHGLRALGYAYALQSNAANSDEAATIVYRVDAADGKYLTGLTYGIDGRAITGSASVVAGHFNVYTSTDLANWTQVGVHTGGGNVQGTVDFSNTVDSVNGAETVYVKVIINCYANFGSSWTMIQGMTFTPAEASVEGNFNGDTNADGVVDIVDLVRFKKAQAGIALASDIADTAYFAGKNNLANDLIYTRKTIIGVDFDVDRSAFEPVVATELPAQSPESKTPTIFEAMSLPVTTSVDATAEYNADRIQFCLDNYGFVTLQSGEYYEIDSAIVLDGKNEVLKTEDPENPAELSFWGDSWYVVQVKGTNNTLKDVIVNQNLNYTTGIHLDTAIVQVVDATNALLDGVTVMGDIDPEPADTTYATGDLGTSTPAALYVLRSTAPVIKNSTFRNCFYGVIFHSSQTEAMNAVMDNCLVTYNRCDGITLAGYAKVQNSEICYNGYDCMNGGEGDPIPGAGIYVEANQIGFVIDNCEIYRNNGFNVDINGGKNGVITNNTIYDAGWTTFPEAADYAEVAYQNGVSLAISGLIGGTVTGNTVTNTDAATVLSGCYAHNTTGCDINGYFGCNNTGTAFGDIPEGGNIIVACFIARGSSDVTVEGNTFTAEAEGVTGYALFVDYISSATLGENTTTGNVLQAVAVETEE